MATRSLGTLTLDLIAKIGGYVGPLDKAARTTKKNSSDMSKDIKSIGIAAAALGATAAIAFAALAKASINAADDLSKASQQIGYSVESLSALKFTAGLAGVEFEGLITSLGKFNKNIAETVKTGTGPAADAFADLQIQLVGTDGKLKSTEVLFTEVAEKLSILEDGAIKTALAQDLLGRSGSKLIPLLNGGADGIKAGADEAARLNQVIGTDAAKAAEQFNDNLTRLKASVTGIANVAAMEAIPQLVEMSDIFSDPEFQQGISTVASGLVTATGALAGFISGVGNFTKWAGEEFASRFNGINNDDVVRIEGLLDKLKAERDKGFFTRASNYRDDNALEAAIKQTEDQLRDAYKRMEEDAAATAKALKNSIAYGVADLKEENTLTAEQIEANRKLREQREAAEKAAKKLAEQQAAQAKKLQEDYDSITGVMEKQIALYGDTTKAAEIRYELENGYLKGITDKQQKYYIGLAEQLDLLEKQKDVWDEIESHGGPDAVFADIPKFSDTPKEDIKKFLEFTEDAAERINGAFSDAWMNIENGWEGLRDGIVDSFKRMLAEMAHEALTKPIVMQIQQSITGGAGSVAGTLNPAGIYAGVGLAVLAGVSAWNDYQDKKFEKLTAEYRQSTQSLGTVLGEANKKSESIGNSIDKLGALAGDSLGINNAMLLELMQIRDGIAGVSAGFARQFGIRGGGDFSNIKTGTTTFNQDVAGYLLIGMFKPISDLIGGQLGGFIDSVIGGVSKAVYSKKKKIIDSGLKFTGQTLADILETGLVDVMGYAAVQTKKKVLGITSSNKVKEQLAGLDDALLDQFAGVFENAAQALDMASGVFGIAFDDYIKDLAIDPQKLSLKGLEGDALVAEIEAFFSSTLDNWAEIVLGVQQNNPAAKLSEFAALAAKAAGVNIDAYGDAVDSISAELTRGAEILKEFQRVGEGAFETMIRLAGETSAFADAAEKLNFNFNVVGMAAVEAVQYLADAAGGFEALSRSVSNYAGKFLSEAEKIAFAEKVVGEGFSKLGLAVPQTREAFAALVQGLEITTEQGREQFAAIMNLVDASDAYIGALEKQTKAAEEAQKVALSGAFDSLTQAVQAERDVLDKINQTAINALQKSLTEHQAVANSLSSALSNMALESSRADLMTRRAAKAQVIAANAIAKAGGPLPGVGQLDKALEMLARPSEQLYATFEEYATDFYATQKSLMELQAVASGQVSIDEQALKNQEDYFAAEMERFDELLEFYQDQLDTLNGIDNSVLTVVEAVNDLTALLSGAGVNFQVPAGLVTPTSYAAAQSLAQPYAYTPLTTAAAPINPATGGYVVADLLTEIQALREELAASQFAIAKNTMKSRQILERWEGDGLPPEREEEEA